MVVVGDIVTVTYDKVMQEQTIILVYWAHLHAGDTTTINRSWEDAPIYVLVMEVLARQERKMTIHVEQLGRSWRW